MQDLLKVLDQIEKSAGDCWSLLKISREKLMT